MARCVNGWTPWEREYIHPFPSCGSFKLVGCERGGLMVSEDWENPGWWQIAHAETGGLIFKVCFATESLALAVAEFLLERGDFTLGVPDIVMKNREAHRAACLAFGIDNRHREGDLYYPLSPETE